MLSKRLLVLFSWFYFHGVKVVEYFLIVTFLSHSDAIKQWKLSV